MPTKTEAIKNFLNKKTWTDLAALYNADMEVQVLVTPDGGEPVEGEFRGKAWRGWTDNVSMWKGFRIPYKANSEPEFDDKEIPYNNSTFNHIEGIGLTGWDWRNRRSLWLGYDYDAIVGHSDRHKKRLTDQELHDLEQALGAIPWVTIRQSTSGKGKHIYVFVDAVETNTHTEHAALARAVLGIMSGMTGMDLSGKVDAMGGILWIYHRKMEVSNGEGLKLIKKGGTLRDIPTNWRDHIDVINGKNRKAKPFFIKDNDNNDFEELVGQHVRVILDNDHKKLIDWLSDNGLSGWWDADHHMLVTHTAYLVKAHEELGFKGVFKTIASGSEYGHDINCFCHPLRHGAWVVRRYTPGVAETDTWTQDSKGYTKCYLNKNPDFDIACIASGGLMNDKNGYVFTEAELAINAVQMLGGELKVPLYMRTRKAIVRKGKNDKLVVEMDKSDNDRPNDLNENGFVADKKLWQKVFPISVSPNPSDAEIQNFDDIVRHLITEDGEEYGWAVNSEGSWKRYMALEPVKLVMEALGETPKEARIALGSMVLKSWTVVNRPFQSEYLENRVWNMKPVQFAVLPNKDENRSFHTYQKILDHVGANLNEAVLKSQWCQNNGILTGGDYLKCWLASVIQYPLESLPYLFLYGNEDSGKSVFHESLRFLFTKGIVRADNALINQSGFNAELEHAIVCVIEEINLSKSGSPAYNRIKDWVLAPEMSIHKKQRTPYLQPNSTHWVQTANDITFVPVGFGDTRIVVIKVDDLDPKEKIPKRFFEGSLRKEAADFLGELLSMELPDPIDRFNIPVLVTDDKAKAQASNSSPLQNFIHEECHNIPGHKLMTKEFKGRFHEWLVDQGMTEEIANWTSYKINNSLPDPYFVGKDKINNQSTIINISFDANATPGKKLIIKHGKVEEE